MQNQNVNGIWETAIDNVKRVFGGKSSTELQAVSTGVAQGTVQSIDKIENISKYLLISGIIIVGLIVYSKLK